jgi:outer membrane protein
VARADQAKAGILPQANLSAGASRAATRHQHPGSDRTLRHPEQPWVSASQPLYRPANWATYKQGRARSTSRRRS